MFLLPELIEMMMTATVMVMMRKILMFLTKRITASSCRRECSYHSEFSDKEAINSAYAQPNVLQKSRNQHINNICFALCLIFAGYVVLAIFLAFVCTFFGFIFKYAKVLLTRETWEVYKQLIIAFM